MACSRQPLLDSSVRPVTSGEVRIPLRCLKFLVPLVSSRFGHPSVPPTALSFALRVRGRFLLPIPSRVVFRFSRFSFGFDHVIVSPSDQRFQALPQLHQCSVSRFMVRPRSFPDLFPDGSTPTGRCSTREHATSSGYAISPGNPEPEASHPPRLRSCPQHRAVLRQPRPSGW